MAKLALKNLSYCYPQLQKNALDNINLSVSAGEFILLTGSSGSGKSTLLKAMLGLVPDFTGGSITGNIYLDEKPMKEWSHRERVQKIGMLTQHPESQMLMTSVEKEIVFGMENLGLDNDLMLRRMAETAAYLNLTGLLKASTPDLSGGEKQKIALASVLAMQPEILLLDEPISQLDPVAAEELLSILKRINEENAVTIVMAEQRLERCFHLVDRVLMMENGIITCDAESPAEFARWARNNNSAYIPAVPYLFAGIDCPRLPLNVKEGRQFLDRFPSVRSSGKSVTNKNIMPKSIHDETVIDIHKLWFTYPGGQEALKNINIKICRGDFIVFMGDNGAGKSTLLKNINGLLKPQRGKVIVKNQDTRHVPVERLARYVAYLPQDPTNYLFMPSVKEEIEFALKNLAINEENQVNRMITVFGLKDYADCNPRDLSSGEMQRAALASLLVSNPEVLLLDEPTRGLDFASKKELGNLLLRLQKEGTTIIMVSHDVEFVAEYASDVYLLTRGEIAAEGSKYEIMKQSNFYSPQVNRLFRGYVEGVLTYAEGRQALNNILLNETAAEAN